MAIPEFELIEGKHEVLEKLREFGEAGLVIDQRTDLYALGVALYGVVTGSPPFSREWDRLAPDFDVGYTMSSAGGDLITNLSDELNYSFGALGVRFNPTGNLLVSVNVVSSLSSDGLEDTDLVPVVAVDYSF